MSFRASGRGVLEVARRPRDRPWPFAGNAFDEIVADEHDPW